MNNFNKYLENVLKDRLAINQDVVCVPKAKDMKWLWHKSGKIVDIRNHGTLIDVKMNDDDEVYTLNDNEVFPNKYMEMAKSPKGDVFDTDSYFNSIEPKAGMMTAFELALHVIDNWKEITGLPTRAMNREGEFPEEVLALIDDNGIDYQDFVDEFTTTLG